MNAPYFCPCGSCQPCWALYDGYGIFMTYVCDSCHSEKLSHFRDDIFTQYDTEGEQIEEDY